MHMRTAMSNMKYTTIMPDTDEARTSGETDDPDSRQYESVSHLRESGSRQEDIRILDEHHPEILTKL